MSPIMTWSWLGNNIMDLNFLVIASYVKLSVNDYIDDESGLG